MAALQEYKCPCCGGAIEFDSSLQKMKCPFCDTEFEVETLAAYDEVLQQEGADTIDLETAADNTWQAGEAEGMRVYVCQSCGGEIVGDETLAASKCPYCDNPIVMMGNFAGELRPDLVIPFKLDKQAAKDAFMQHLKGKPLLPKVFKDESHIDEIKGIYVPFWLFDADTHANIRYRATRVRHWSDSRYNYTETSYFSVLRAGDLSFDDVPVDGSSKMPDDLMESIEPFDMKDAVDFQTAYLAGYLADKFDVDADASKPRIQERVKRSTETALAATVLGYATVLPEGGSVQTENGKARYALLPVWILNTTWNGEKYIFAMNGQTGKFVGNLPTDKAALTRWFLGALAAGTAAALAIQYLVWLL